MKWEEREERFSSIVSILLMVGFCVCVFLYYIRDESACTGKGGVLVRDAWWFECVEPKR